MRFLAAVAGALAVGAAALWLQRDPTRCCGANVYLAQTKDRVTAHLVLPHPNAEPGLAHYTEHLAWLNAVGGERSADRHSNAWTSAVAVGYWLSGAPESLSDILDTLSGVFDPIALPRDFAEQERDIVLREFELRMVNAPIARAAEAMDAFLYAGTALANSVIGTPDEIAALDLDAARALHGRTHVRENARLVVIGDVSARQLRRALREAGWAGSRDDPPAPPSFAMAAPDAAALRYPEPAAAPRLVWRRVVTLPQPVPFDLLEARTALLRDILDSNLPGGLAGPLRFDAAVARVFEVRIRPLDEDDIEIGFSAAPDRGVSLAALQASFEATLGEVAAEGIPEATYSRVLNRFDDFWPDWDNPDETARWMASYVLDRVSGLRQPLPRREVKRLHRGLSRDTTNALLRQLAGEGRTAAAFIGPEDVFQ